VILTLLLRLSFRLKVLEWVGYDARLVKSRVHRDHCPVTVNVAVCQGGQVVVTSGMLTPSKFSMTSFYVTSFICSSVRATLIIFSMTSALIVQKLAC
jgi:hypothetical protein